MQIEKIYQKFSFFSWTLIYSAITSSVNLHEKSPQWCYPLQLVLYVWRPMKSESLIISLPFLSSLLECPNFSHRSWNFGEDNYSVGWFFPSKQSYYGLTLAKLFSWILGWKEIEGLFKTSLLVEWIDLSLSCLRLPSGIHCLIIFLFILTMTFVTIGGLRRSYDFQIFLSLILFLFFFSFSFLNLLFVAFGWSYSVPLSAYQWILVSSSKNCNVSP